jgi:hypothetical protein
LSPRATRTGKEERMKRALMIVASGALMLALATGLALAALRIGDDQSNKLFGTYGDNVGQDNALLGFGAGDLLVGRSAADQLAGGSG